MLKIIHTMTTSHSMNKCIFLTVLSPDPKSVPEN